jgi:hypothetical protein
VRPILVLSLATLLVLAGCIGSKHDDEGGPSDPKRTDEATERVLHFNSSGTATGTPVQPYSKDFPVEVPRGALEVGATLTWTASPLADLRLVLVDPEGKPVERGFPEKPGQASTATVDPPASGKWIVRVTSSRALDVPYKVAAKVSLVVPLNNVLSESIVMQPGGFAELNLIMEGNASFAWGYNVREEGGSIDWNIHSHENGRTIIHEEGKGRSHKSNFTAPKRQIYSILFENIGVSAVNLQYTVEGQFRVHSHSQ